MSHQRKYWRELLRHLPDGYTIAYQHVDAVDRHGQKARKLGKHPVVYRPDGTIVRSPEGRPVIVSSSPGSPHTITRDLRCIAHAGVPVK